MENLLQQVRNEISILNKDTHFESVVHCLSILVAEMSCCQHHIQIRIQVPWIRIQLNLNQAKKALNPDSDLHISDPHVSNSFP